MGTPISLQELQSHFSHYVLQGDEQIKKDIVSTAALKSDLRLAIYAHGYIARLVEALETDYSALNTVMGDDSFMDLAEQYIKQYPSTYTSLRFFGNKLSEFIQSHTYNKDHPYLSELATMEWLLATGFNAADAPVLGLDDFAEVPAESWPTLSLDFHPAVQWFSYKWNIIALWKAAKSEKPLPTPEKLETVERCLVWRAELKTMFRTLDFDEAKVLPEALQGMTFGEICERLAEDASEPDTVPMQAAGLLKSWVSAGLVCGLKY